MKRSYMRTSLLAHTLAAVLSLATGCSRQSGQPIDVKIFATSKSSEEFISSINDLLNDLGERQIGSYRTSTDEEIVRYIFYSNDRSDPSGVMRFHVNKRKGELFVCCKILSHDSTTAVFSSDRKYDYSIDRDELVRIDLVGYNTVPTPARPGIGFYDHRLIIETFDGTIHKTVFTNGTAADKELAYTLKVAQDVFFEYSNLLEEASKLFSTEGMREQRKIKGQVD